MTTLDLRREALAPLADADLASVAGGTVNTLRCPTNTVCLTSTADSCITGYCTSTLICPR